MVEIEQNLLIQRYQNIIVLKTNAFQMCGICRFEIAIFECYNCKESYCKICQDDAHFFIRDHKMKYIIQNITNEIDRSQYSILENQSMLSLQESKKEVQQETKNNDSKKDIITTTSKNSKVSIKSEEPTIIPSNIKMHYKIITNYRKLQKFFFPINPDLSTFEEMKKAFKNLYDIYFITNKIQKGVQKVASINDGIYRYQMSENNKIKFNPSQDLEKFFQNLAFTIEDKIFLNRACFMLFQQKGQDTTFDDFIEVFVNLQTGTFQSKLQQFGKFFQISNLPDIVELNQMNELISIFLISTIKEKINIVKQFFEYKKDRISNQKFYQTILKNELLFQVFSGILSHRAHFNKYVQYEHQISTYQKKQANEHAQIDLQDTILQVDKNSKKTSKIISKNK